MYGIFGQSNANSRQAYSCYCMALVDYIFNLIWEKLFTQIGLWRVYALLFVEIEIITPFTFEAFEVVNGIMVLCLPH